MSAEHELADADLAPAIESILLVASEPVGVTELAAAARSPRSEVERALTHLASTLTGGIRLQRDGERVQLVTAPENVDVVQRFLGAERPAPLSRAVLETLTAIAYEQPVTRAEIEALRGVDSDYSLRKLLARGLVEERGRREVLGRPVEYGTTMAFLEYFGLNSLAELPNLPERGPDVDASNLGLRA